MTPDRNPELVTAQSVSITEKDPVPVYLPNRRERRKSNQPVDQEVAAVTGELKRVSVAYNEIGSKTVAVINQYEKNLTQIVYLGEPFIYRFLEIQRSIPSILERAHTVNLKHQFITTEKLNVFDDIDFFPRKINGTSLLDVEQMELDEKGQLYPDDIKRINQIFHNSLLRKLLVGKLLAFLPSYNQSEAKSERDEQAIRQAIFFFVTQDLARPEQKITISDNLRPLHRRLRAYFDYYTDLMTDFDMDFWDESRFLKTLQWTTPWLSQTLGCYIPARLGITPASAIKLYQTHAEISPLPYLTWHRPVLYSLEKGSQDAFREKGLPKDLQDYQHYNKTADKSAATLLEQYYSNQKLTDSDKAERCEQADELCDRMTNLYFKPLYEDITYSPQKRLYFNMPDEHIVQKIVLTYQNRQTLVFILQFRDGQTHLTLEIDKNQKYYGLPAKMAVDQPDSLSLIFADILTPVLDQVRLRHPRVEPITINKPEIKPPVISQPEEEPTYIRPIKEKPPSKQNRALTPILQVLLGPEPPKQHETSTRQFTVLYSHSQVKEFIGKNIPEHEVDLIMREIKHFEFGHSDLKKLEDVGDLYELRSGNYRIVLRHKRGKFYTVEDVGHRKDIFRSHKISPKRYAKL